MAAIRAEQINPFLMSARSVMQTVCGIDIKFGKIEKTDFKLDGDPMLIMLGITGELSGQACFVMSIEIAKKIASKMMMGMPVEEFDDMARSAISELGNMVMGNAATILSNNNVLIDITPPTIITGTTSIQSPDSTMFKVPLIYENYSVMLCFMFKNL
ncbi:MAG: chemotaxis protein CheX [Lachnospiraceae bacterium]|nr:chemotaxis protein CheX [Lachnospiraceae bacterium]MBP5248725.1 chemotaxis protein CheX [Lachnospiraceae bacterium]